MSKLTIVKESNEKFVIEGAEYEALRVLVYQAYRNLCDDLDDKDLSETTSIYLSKGLDTLRKLKQIIVEDTP